MNAVGLNLSLLGGAKAQAVQKKQVLFGHDVRTLRVQEVGSVTRQPDSFVAHFNLQYKAAEQKALIAEMNKVETLVDKLKNLGLEKLQIETGSPRTNPNYEWNHKTQEQKQDGWVGSQTVSVSAKGLPKGDLAKYAAAIQTVALDFGVYQSVGFTPYVSKQKEAENSAIGGAIRLAKKSAQVAAKALGFKLGDAVNVVLGNDGNYGRPVRHAKMAAMAPEMGGGAVSEGAFQFGPQEISSPPVTVEFELVKAEATAAAPAEAK